MENEDILFTYVLITFENVSVKIESQFLESLRFKACLDTDFIVVKKRIDINKVNILRFDIIFQKYMSESDIRLSWKHWRDYFKIKVAVLEVQHIDSSCFYNKLK